MVIDERDADGEPVAVRPFAWNHFLAIVGGTVLIIATICTLATLLGKQEARFSFNDQPAAVAIA